MERNKTTWIWYPGDFEIWLGNIFNNRRTERGAMFPPFWKQDSHYVTVEFSREFNLDREETITIACEGQFNLMLDGKLQFGQPKTFTIPQGKHKLNLKVWNQATPPALFIEGATIHTDSTWLVTYEDKIWIDENGVAHGSGIYVPAASWNFDDIDTPPSQYRLERSEQHPVCSHAVTTNGTLYDFGKETFGYLKIKGLKGCIHIYYGESAEEAMDKEHCETLDILTGGQSPCEICDSKAFRYVYIETEQNASYEEVLMDFEYAPMEKERSGSFRCSDELLNNIWDTAAYTMDLTTREFFMDGIKRDRWTWSGDAIQSYLMNYYLRFDTECVKRTIRQLRGKDPVTAHVNTIMDYTFYWFKSIHDYYLYTADLNFVREMWSRMVTLMDYVEGRLNGDGMAEGKSDDWIFVDWVDFPMHKRGTLCFEQILLMKAMETMAVCAKLLGVKTDYRVKAESLRNKIKQTFWSYERKAYYHAIEEGQMNQQITKFPNMFAILYGLAYEEERHEIMKSVMLNPAIDPITTPYMRFYELETLCIDGLQTEVLQEIRDYWGGMLHEGATSFWEKYNPEETGTQHLAMYGRPYGKSLCHAWGASPIYLIGKYYLGVQPTKPGYEEYLVKPVLGDLQWMEGDVPTPFGKIHVSMSRQEVTIYSDGGHGTLMIGEKEIEIPAKQEIKIGL
ncbi:amylo-alpha-1,6-glucosidase [Prevotella sp. tf2-5]|uniref:alpha-L-rhamnosidase-related protein n=1 Tax=Prevotella sp. tf2-5 TaxID=1761889 RepID=UPI0008E25927|nr:amylo-alpha-1,6-glucosidase [Prevotella sp. tf2-5]SFO64337.1 alpha-L-rhamnosidase [Prevotella sp. tf2-5]